MFFIFHFDFFSIIKFFDHHSDDARLKYTPISNKRVRIFSGFLVFLGIVSMKIKWMSKHFFSPKRKNLLFTNTAFYRSIWVKIDRNEEKKSMNVFLCVWCDQSQRQQSLCVTVNDKKNRKFEFRLKKITQKNSILFIQTLFNIDSFIH